MPGKEQEDHLEAPPVQHQLPETTGDGAPGTVTEIIGVAGHDHKEMFARLNNLTLTIGVSVEFI